MYKLSVTRVRRFELYVRRTGKRARVFCFVFCFTEVFRDRIFGIVQNPIRSCRRVPLRQLLRRVIYSLRW